MMIDTEFDQNHLWHPYTSAINPLPCYPVKRCEGVHIELEDGTRVIDGMASWWSVIHGYNHPNLNQAIQNQLHDMSHVMFGGLTHAPAINLGKLLMRMTQHDFDRIFYADSGSVSVEVALKMALQYQQAYNPKKTRFLSLRGGYHGDTFAAMSVCDPDNGMHSLFKKTLPEHLFLPRPESKPGSSIKAAEAQHMQAIFEQHGENLAAVIVEPLVQGAGGMHFYDASYLSHLKSLCEATDTLLIFDEIATGFGRTGENFAYQYAGVKPDILCLGKALTGGYMTLAATLCTQAVAEGVCHSKAGVFMHGPTFMANPLACSVAIASLTLLESYDLKTRINTINHALTEGLAPCSTLASVKEVRSFGAIAAIDMHEPIDVARMQKALISEGVWLRPFNRLLYMYPSYVMTQDQIKQITTAVVKILSAHQ